MGKKATILLFWILYAGFTVFLSLLAVVARFAGSVSPEKSFFIAVLALGLTPILILNCLNFMVWIFRLSKWALFPLVAIILNWNYITAVFHIDLNREKIVGNVITATDSVKTVQINKDFSVATYNIHGFYHRNFKNVLNQTLDHFNDKDVDLICFQEFYKHPDSTLSVNAHFPYSVVLSDNVGMQLAVFSKYPLSNERLVSFEESKNAAMTVETEVNGQKIFLVNVHFQTTNFNQSHQELTTLKDYGIDTPDGMEAFDVIMQRLSENANLRTKQVAVVESIVKQNLKDIPLILCGDFNDTPASYTYCQIRNSLNDGFVEGGNGYSYTYNLLYKLFRLDYIMYNDKFKVFDYFSEELPWSDHNPVMLKFCFLHGGNK